MDLLLYNLVNALVAAGVFFGFIFLIWWCAWELSLSKVPLLREVFGYQPRRENTNSNNKRDFSGNKPTKKPTKKPQLREKFEIST